jgi:tetraacyldisaccharide-1-P 4'-kinase
MGADMRAAHALSDHQPLSDTLMTRMLREAAALGAQVVTTEKDAVRLSPDAQAPGSDRARQVADRRLVTDRRGLDRL